MQVDLLIIGGGINGAGIARDAAGRGLSVVLCERHDLASGTSQASSKLIHGGLRYLEYGEWRLVREALTERESLLAIAPHIIWPLRFHLPWEKHLRPRWLIRLGLFLYDHLYLRQKLARSTYYRRTDAKNNPLKASFNQGFCYSDCWVDDARLVTLNAMDASLHGATVLTQAQCTEVERHQDHWQATIQSKDGQSISLQAKAIINATGPWVDDTQQQLLKLKQGTPPRLQKVKGSHLVFAKLYEGNQAYILQHSDKRIVFILPFCQDYTLIGTTDVPFSDAPENAQLSTSEADYLCQVVNHYLNIPIQAKDALWHYSGVRGLLAEDGKSASALSRDYHLELDCEKAALLTIFGGKAYRVRPRLLDRH
jgi:glycerol-3-phosphate dehydrogenase